MNSLSSKPAAAANSKKPSTASPSPSPVKSPFSLLREYRGAIISGIALLVGICGFVLRQGAGPVYIATAKVVLPNALNFPGKGVTDPGHVLALLKGSDPEPANRQDSLEVAQQISGSTTYIVTARAVGVLRADKLADNASESLKNQDWRFDRLVSRLHRPGSRLNVSTDMAHIVQAASDQEPQVDPNSQVTPFTHLLEMFLYITLALFGGGGLIFMIGKAAERRPLSSAGISPALSNDALSDLPHIHTLVTVTQVAPRTIGRSGHTANLVYGTGHLHPDDIPSHMVLAHASIQQETAIDLSVNTDIDEIFFERLAEYKRYYEKIGCVLLVTETLPSAFQSQTGGMFPSLNGAVAALSLARTVALQTGISTMVIDTGSPEWTAFRKSKNPPDVMNLPKMPGVYELIANKGSLQDWIFEEEAIPGLMALTSGKVPRDWPEILRSKEMGEMIAKARELADLIVIYAPRVIERPETVRIMGEWTNGIMIVSGVDVVAEAVEMQAVSMLHSAGATVFGRIALDTLESVGIDEMQADMLKQSEVAAAAESN